jgi:site-specific recombinase XerD
MTRPALAVVPARTSAELIDEYVSDMQRAGRLLGPHSEKAYRRTLELHAEDAGEVGLLDADRLDIKRTLARWPHANSQRRNHSCLVSFYRWAMEEGYRPANPAEQVRKAKRRSASVYRLTREEVQAMMDACETLRETRLIYLGLCTGARRAELMGLRGRHFQRAGWVQIAADAGAKGMKERWIPTTLPEMAPIAATIRATVAPDGPVLISEGPRSRGYGLPLDYTTITRIVGTVAERAGIGGHVTPHTLRHAFGTHVARFAGLRAAQMLMGHADISTTAKIYVEAPTLDEIQESVEGFSYRGEASHARPNLVLLSADHR